MKMKDNELIHVIFTNRKGRFLLGQVALEYGDHYFVDIINTEFDRDKYLLNSQRQVKKSDCRIIDNSEAVGYWNGKYKYWQKHIERVIPQMAL